MGAVEGRENISMFSIPQKEDRRTESRPLAGELEITLQGLPRVFTDPCVHSAANAMMIVCTRTRPICTARQEEPVLPQTFQSL